jgi:hypothetical protein
VQKSTEGARQKHRRPRFSAVKGMQFQPHFLIRVAMLDEANALMVNSDIADCRNPPRLVGPGEVDDDFDALPCDPLQPAPVPTKVRPEIRNSLPRGRRSGTPYCAATLPPDCSGYHAAAYA